MKKFMIRFLEAKNLSFRDNVTNKEPPEFESLVSLYSGVNGTRSFQNMSEAFDAADWVWRSNPVFVPPTAGYYPGVSPIYSPPMYPSPAYSTYPSASYYP